MTEREKMLSGNWYDAVGDPEIQKMRLDAEELCQRYNLTTTRMETQRRYILSLLLAELGEGVTILPPFFVDYGQHCSIGGGTFVNHGAYLMDPAWIRIGRHCCIGPNLGAYTAHHPLIASERATGMEMALPITIEDDVWIGGSVTILPGVTVGHGSVVGAGSVVTRDVPPEVIVTGNPARVRRSVDPADSMRNPPCSN